MKNCRKGFVLILSLLTSSIIIILTIPYISRVVSDYAFTAKIYNITAALDLAEAGVDRALWEIYYGPSKGQFPDPGLISGWSNTTYGNGDAKSSLSNQALQTAGTGPRTIGYYDVEVLRQAATQTNPKRIIITATGYVPNKLSSDKKTVRVVLNSASKSKFTAAIASLGNIVMSGAVQTDSYDSGKGAYNELLPNGSYNTGHEGDIMANGSISISGSVFIDGDANPGADYPFTTIPNVSGSYGTLQAPIVVDPIPQSDIDAAKLSNNNDNIIHAEDREPVGADYSLNVSGSDAIILPGGTYYFTSISISGSLTINTSGSVIIYVDGGDINISGSGLINPGQPRNLLIYSTGDSIKYSGSAHLMSAIYAPSAYFKLSGSAELFGAIVCGSNTDTGTSNIHYDRDLLNLNPLTSADANYTISSWQEI